MVKGYFDRILDVLSDGVYISDDVGVTLKVNSAYEQLTGLKKEELLGKNVRELKSEGKYDVALNPEIVRSGKPKTSVQVTRVGRKVILNGYPVFDKAGKVALVVTFVRDVTLLSQLKEQLAYQKELIDGYHSEVQYLSKKEFHSSFVVPESKEMRSLINSLGNVARTDATVLILGETGVGKDVLARRIHENSLRYNQPFFKIDCASIPQNLVESELFGYDPGAFSGANTKGKPGFFEMANKGTLFLDEIGELPISMQCKLLRVLQDQEIMRIGSTKVRKVDIRFIAATNRNLEDAVREGTFRSDLFYRLRVAVLNVPSLRERKEDIVPLTEFFLEKYNYKYKKRLCLSNDALKVLQNYRWPGNIREMENMIQSLIVTSEQEFIDMFDLPSYMLPVAAHDESRSLNDIMADIEKELLKKALEVNGTVARVAKAFKIDRTTVFRKMKKYSLIR